MAIISQYDVVIPGQSITAALWNAMELNIINVGLIPSGIEDNSSDNTEAQLTTDPYTASSLVKATTLKEEIQQIRYQLDLIIGQTYWYEDPSVDLENLSTHDHSTYGATIVTAGITDGAVTAAKLASGVSFPATTGMAFYQASAPTGWTAVALNDKFLRVVTAGGTGGSSGGSGLVPSDTITLAHTHTVDSHTHSTPAHLHDLEHSDLPSSDDDTGAKIGSDAATGSGLYQQVAGASTQWHYQGTTETSGAGTSGGTAPATDSQLSNTAFQYADLIVATKD